MKPIILVLAEVYLPGYLAGGPVRSIANLVAHLGDDFIWKIITTDRDFHAKLPYHGIEPGQWIQVDAAEVFYASPEWLAPRAFIELIRKTPHDLLYLNSFFSPRFSILPMLARRFGESRQRPALIAPRGEFSPGALALKWWKKRPFIASARTTYAYADAQWHASTEQEATDIMRVMSASRQRIHVAANLGVLSSEPPKMWGRHDCDALRVCFLSRISRKKNLDFALRVLGMVTQPVIFTIFGPKEDATYWRECEHLMGALPDHVNVNYAGAVHHERVIEELSRHDLFLLPTRGENYGHVLVEAWMAGLPVLISDQTPWQDLESKGVGWDLPLARPDLFAKVINETIWPQSARLQEMRRKCVAFGRERARSDRLVENNRLMFSAAIDGKPMSCDERTRQCSVENKRRDNLVP